MCIYLTVPLIIMLFLSFSQSFQLNELTEAEDALSEANILNNSDPEVWGYLSLVCLKTGRQLEAEQAYKYAIKVKGAIYLVLPCYLPKHAKK